MSSIKATTKSSVKGKAKKNKVHSLGLTKQESEPKGSPRPKFVDPNASAITLLNDEAEVTESMIKTLDIDGVNTA